MGRVQTPTLALLVKRDREIAAFVPQDYWEVRADFGDFEGLYYDPETRQSRAATKEQADKIKREAQGKEGTVVESRRERKRVPPPQLFDLTTLQREANRRFGFSADKTLKLAQALYERHKTITYPVSYTHLDVYKRQAVALRRVGRPQVVQADVLAEVFREDGAVQRADNGDVQPGGLFEQRLHLRAVLADDADVVAAGLAGPFLLLSLIHI